VPRTTSSGDRVRFPRFSPRPCRTGRWAPTGLRRAAPLPEVSWSETGGEPGPQGQRRRRAGRL